MALVLLVKAEDRESAASPEMRYLLSLVRLEAERTFGEAEVVGCADGADKADYVLLLGGADVLIREASLAAMRAAVDAGADAAVPHRLADTGLAAGAAVYTLRDFERLEERWLAGDGESIGEPPSLLPVALLCGEAFRRLGGEVRDIPPRDLRVARAGLYHEFIDYYGEVRTDVVPFVPAGAGEILEVGCGRGATGEHLQEALGCRVTGVELNPVVAEAARGVLHRVVVGDVEDEATVAELGRRYDALLALELFEHLVEPERFLGRVRELVRPGGRVVLSVPNVGHHSVAADLLAGRWDYLPIGILCYTHYRFYTRRTLADWLARAGFPDARLVPQRTAAPDWLTPGSRRLPGTDLEIDEESLSTKGFYVTIDL
jgi:2-polyprenyl-3-methyl-5-hydroxy-6-metoxy-1,4-benzoquinol methylase